MSGVIYDTGALIAAERQDAGLLVLHRLIIEEHDRPIVPAVVLAQAWRGASNPRLAHLLKGCLIVPDNEIVAKAAGALCGVSGTSDVVDAIVVISAITRDALVVTSDPQDIRKLGDALGVRLRIRVI